VGNNPRESASGSSSKPLWILITGALPQNRALLKIQAPFLAGIHKVDLQIHRIHSPLDQARNCCRRDTSLIEHPPNKSTWFDLLHRRISACIILQKESVASTRNCCRSLSQHVQISVPVGRARELWCTAHSLVLFCSLWSAKGGNLKRAGKRTGVCKGFCGCVRETLSAAAQQAGGALRREAGKDFWRGFGS
jgi:hypothetical protein